MNVTTLIERTILELENLKMYINSHFKDELDIMIRRLNNMKNGEQNGESNAR